MYLQILHFTSLAKDQQFILVGDGSRIDSNTLFSYYLDGYIGSIQMFAFEGISDGYLPCDGAEYLKTDYPKLYNKIGDTFGDTNLGYIAPTDNKKFRVPNLQNQFIRNTNGTQPVGTQKTDTMRRIKGHGGENYINNGFPNTGVFTASNAITQNTSNQGILNTGFTTQSIIIDSAKGVEGQEGTVSPNVGSETAPMHTYLVFAIKAK